MPKSEPVDQYDLRGDLYELFHYLNHTVLFGVSNSSVDRCMRSIDADTSKLRGVQGGYASSALRKMEKLLRVLG